MSALPWALSLSTSTALPILLVLLALRTGVQNPELADILKGARAGLVGVLAFVCVFALGPAMEALVRLITAIGPMSGLTTDDSYYQDSFVPGPLALIAVFSIRPMLAWVRSDGTNPGAQRFGRRRFFAALLTMAAVVIGALILSILRLTPAPVDFGWAADRVGSFDKTLSSLINSHATGLVGYEYLASLWLLLCVVILPFSVYWLMRAVVPQVPIARTAIACSALVFILPALGWLSDFTAIRLAPSWMASAQGRLSDDTLSWLSLAQRVSFAAPIITFLAIVALLFAFRDVLAVTLTPEYGEKVKKRAGFWPLVIAAALIIITLAPRDGDLDMAPAVETFNLLWHFQSYAPLLALAAAVSVMTARARLLAQQQADPFERSSLTESLIIAVFVGYVALVWSDDTAATVMVAFAGWISVRYLALDRSVFVPTVRRSPALAARLVKHIERIRLLEQRRDALDEKYASGKLDTVKYDAAVAELEDQRTKAASELGIGEAECKRAICVRSGRESAGQRTDRGSLGADSLRYRATLLESRYLFTNGNGTCHPTRVRCASNRPAVFVSVWNSSQLTVFNVLPFVGAGVGPPGYRGWIVWIRVPPYPGS